MINQQEVNNMSIGALLPEPDFLGIKIPSWKQIAGIRVASNGYVVACAKAITGTNHMEIVYQQYRIDAIKDYISVNLPERTYGKIRALRSVAEIQELLALEGYFINAIAI